MGVNFCRDPVPINPFHAHYFEEQFQRKSQIYNVEDINFPLSTHNSHIVDRSGRRVKFAFVNWSGAHMQRHCVGGLEHRKLYDICREIRQMGFNGIRLTFSLQMFYQNNRVDGKYLTANPQLVGMTAMQIFDLTIEALTNAGLMVLLNNHTSKSMWCCSMTDGQGLWWTEQYPEGAWVECLQKIAFRYRNNKRVIGIDLRNQIRRTPWLSPSWGDNDLLTDWRRAAIIGGNAVLQANPDLLIVIGGISFQLDLTDIKYSPAFLAAPNKLVYSGHFYGFSWFTLNWKRWTYNQFKQKLVNQQTYVRSMGVPFLLGEFGSNTPDIPWNFLTKYLRQTDIDWCYWCLDGNKCQVNEDEQYGIYDQTWTRIRHQWKLDNLRSIMLPKSIK